MYLEKQIMKYPNVYLLQVLASLRTVRNNFAALTNLPDRAPSKWVDVHSHCIFSLCYCIHQLFQLTCATKICCMAVLFSPSQCTQCCTGRGAGDTRCSSSKLKWESYEILFPFQDHPVLLMLKLEYRSVDIKYLPLFCLKWSICKIALIRSLDDAPKLIK